MAKSDNTGSLNKVDAMNKELNELLRGENIVLTGNESGRADEILNIHNRYNDIIQKDYQGIRSSKDPNDSTYEYITNAILGKNRDYSDSEKTFKQKGFTTGNKATDDILKNGQLDRLFTMGDSQVASYFLSSSSDICHIYDEIDSVCEYFYQLEEANLITRDNVLRAEQVNEDISMNITFPGITEDTSSYVSIVKKALEYQNISNKTKLMLAVIFRDYLSTEKQREKILNFERTKELQLEQEAREKYDIDVFKNKRMVQMQQVEENIKEGSQLVKYEEKWYTKIFNNLKNLINKFKRR